MFENNPKSHIQYCERSELRLHFEFLKPETCGQTVLPDTSVKSISIGQKLIANAKIQMRHFE